MKKIIAIAALALTAAVCFTGCTVRVKPLDTNGRTVTVNGTGSVDLKNDQSIVVLSVITRSADVVKASQDNAKNMTRVFDALVEKGISKDQISTSNYSIYQETSYQNGRSIPGLYNVSNQINIIIKDVEKTGEIIDTAIKNGANSLSSLDYYPSGKEAALKQARILAIKQAESNANILAVSSGCVLGKVISITEEGGYAAPRSAKLLTVNSESADAATMVTPGSSTITVTVSTTYQLD